MFAKLNVRIITIIIRKAEIGWQLQLVRWAFESWILHSFFKNYSSDERIAREIWNFDSDLKPIYWRDIISLFLN